MVARDITLPVDPDEAWAALTDPDLLERWFGDGEPLIEQAEPPQRLVVWSAPDAGDGDGDGTSGARVELVLVPVPGGTRVTVTEAPVGPLALATA